MVRKSGLTAVLVMLVMAAQWAWAAPEPEVRIYPSGPTAGSGWGYGGQGAYGRGPRIIVNDRQIAFREPLSMRNGEVVGPVRPFLEALGARVWWDERDQAVRVRRGNVELKLRYSQRRMSRGEEGITLGRAPWSQSKQMYGALLPMARALGDSVQWDKRRLVATIRTRYDGHEGRGTSKEEAIATARDYLKRIDEYPDRVTSVEAHRDQAPANRYWEELRPGGRSVSNAPMRACWIVQFNYHGQVPDAWKQVYVEEASGDVIGGQQTRWQEGRGTTKEEAIATARAYLKRIDEYPDTVTGAEAHRGQAPANRYWEALRSGGRIDSDAPRRACWIVQFNYHGLVPDGWKQVYVEETSGEVIGGQQTR